MVFFHCFVRRIEPYPIHLNFFFTNYFLRYTEGSAIRRIGHARWLRNLALAAGNAFTSPSLKTQERELLLKTLTAWAQHPDPVVQEQVSWSLARA